MEIKKNAATELRPEGARIIDAPLVSICIPEFIKQLKAEVTWRTGDRNAITVFKTNGLRIVLIALHEGLHHSVNAIKESVFLLTLTTSLEA